MSSSPTVGDLNLSMDAALSANNTSSNQKDESKWCIGTYLRIKPYDGDETGQIIYDLQGKILQLSSSSRFGLTLIHSIQMQLVMMVAIDL